MDREKVIKGLETIRFNLRQMNHLFLADFCDDALTLLKEQDKRINMKQRRIDQLCKQLTDLKHRFHEKTELVRCKDCKHKEESVSPSWEAWCNRLHCGCDLNWFCADGEAK